MELYEKLANIQQELKVPKNLYNKFGNYYYRNAETILDAAKPICTKHKTTLVVRDTIENVGERYYVKATAELYDWESDKYITNTAYAREEDNKKGMDASQVTGSCSSYARKYALNGLFCLDDVKDADTDEQHNEIENKGQATDKQIKQIMSLYKPDEIDGMLNRMGKNLGTLTYGEAEKMIAARKDK